MMLTPKELKARREERERQAKKIKPRFLGSMGGVDYFAGDSVPEEALPCIDIRRQYTSPPPTHIIDWYS